MRGLFLLFPLLLTACASPYTPQSASPSPTPAPTTKMVQIISDPPGARIEVNDDYVGDTPLEIKVAQHNGNFVNDTTIRAIPIQQGEYVQSKYFSGTFLPAAIPSRILFDMGLQPVAPAQ